MKGFPAAQRADARILILGSFPGVQSLARREYYAHPHNTFWRIMRIITGMNEDMPYANRLNHITQHGIALWDVCASGDRVGSLDSAIQTNTVIPNDFQAFLQTHPAIKLIAFNGTKAAQLYERKVLPTLPASMQQIPRALLPSTSPAHAAMSFDKKLALWQTTLRLNQ